MYNMLIAGMLIGFGIGGLLVYAALIDEWYNIARQDRLESRATAKEESKPIFWDIIDTCNKLESIPFADCHFFD